MTNDRWARVKNTLHAALELPPNERAAFLAETAGDDAELRSEVEALLAADAPGVESADETRQTAYVPRGNRLGSYEILAPIGAGGMGEVYRARDTRLHRDVALKVLPEAFADDAERLARFKREAQLLAALNHPHIAAIYGLEESGGRSALVLELVEGDTLAERIRKGAPPLDEALNIAGQIAEALVAAHHKSIVHRDLKPANIKVTPDGTVKVLDFGLAKTAASFERSHASEIPTRTGDTRIGTILGTAAYMSPEQARGEQVDARTDIWAFGCVLFELLTGRRAFGASDTTSSATRILEREPEWQMLPAITPRAVQELLRRCLDKDPARRPQAMHEVQTVIETVLARPSARLRWAAAAAAALVAAAALYLALRPAPSPLVNRADWTPITSLDSATQPALSPDGSMVAFVRGPSTFVGPGQVYVKQLPDGEPIALTSDDRPKMSPVFSPDGSRIAYTVNEGDSWDTWEVPVLRGAPRQWLKNASGLVWVGTRDVLFSEIKRGLHMAIVKAGESRAGARDIYLPAHSAGMAHRSYGSPDGQWALIVEMNEVSVWVPCRLLRIDGSSSGPVGPAPARCTNAAWSPDQRWMYFNADAGDGYHVWRQRFPDGVPEQLTNGPTEEEGLALAPDGRSLITSVGLSQRSVWIHDERGDRQISLEGYAYWPLLTADGTRILFRVSRGTATQTTPTDLYVADVATGQTRRLFPGQQVTGYDLSPDDRVVASVVQPGGARTIWIAALDARQPPRQVPGAIGESPRFGRRGDVIFVAAEREGLYLVWTREDGSERRTLGEIGSNVGGTVSPDGEWISGISADRGHMVAFSVQGSPPVPIFPYSHSSRLRWSADGSRLYFSIQYGAASAFAAGRTYSLPMDKGGVLPAMPAGGFRTEAEIAALPGIESVPYGDVVLGPSSSVYAFSKITTTRNLYRIPLE